MRCRVQRQREATAAAPRSEQRREPGPQGRAPQSERPGTPARSLARAKLECAQRASTSTAKGPNADVRARFISGAEEPVGPDLGPFSEQIRLAEEYLAPFGPHVRNKVMFLNALKFYRRTHGHH